MNRDRRVKGCPNEDCRMHSTRKKFSSRFNYCPECGSELIFVCEKCFSEIEDLGPEHRKCRLCEAEEAAKKEKVKDTAKNAAMIVADVAPGKALEFGAGLAVAALGGAKKEGVKQAAAVGGKAVKKAVEIIPKVIVK